MDGSRLGPAGGARRHVGPALFDQELDDGLDAGAGPSVDDLADLGSSPPAVVAVVVARGAAPRLHEVVAALRDQDYPNLAVLVVDAGSPVDPTPRIAAELPTAYVRRLETDPGFAAAADEALLTVEGAPFLLFCHSGVVLDQGALRALVEEAFRSNAGIVGPKIVDADQPEVLLSVGLAIDKFGTTYSGIEPGEIDQEQHDAVRDVFYVPSSALLVRADLFRMLGGFDPDLSDEGEDLDLCWRARLAGARVVVAPDARALENAAEHAPSDERGRPANRNRLRTLLKAYSSGSLARIVPQALVVTTVEAFVLLALGRRRQASALVGAWRDTGRNWRQIRRARASIQSTRVVADADIRFLQVTGSARARDFVLGRIEHGGRGIALVRSGRELVDATTEQLRWMAVLCWLALLLVPLVGARDLIVHGVSGVGSLVPWPSVPTMLRDLGSPWRFGGLGSVTPPAPGLAVLAGLGTVLFGSVGLARTLLVVAALPVATVAAYRLGRNRGLGTGPAMIVAASYGANPVGRNILAAGRLGPLVLFAIAPLVVARVLAVATGERMTNIRVVVGAGLVAAVVVAVYPVAALFTPVVALALLAAAPVDGRVRLAWRALGAALGSTVVAVVLLLPWSLSLVLPGSDPASAGFAFRPRLDISAVMRFASSTGTGGWRGLALAVAAALPLLAARRARLPLLTRAWALIIAGWGIAFVSGQRWSAGPWPAPEVALTVAAVGAALAIGAGAAVFLDELPRRSFGWRHATAVVGGAALVVAGLAAVGAAGDGRYGLPNRDWASSISWMDTGLGGFRLLWAGDPTVLPLDPWSLPDGTGYGLSRNGAPDARDLWPVSAAGTTGLVGDALRDAIGGRTERLGHLLAPMGVRYVAVPLRRGPRASGADQPWPRLTTALDEQVDLSRLAIESGLVLYENVAWLPVGAVVAPASLPASALTAEVAGSPSALGRPGWRGASGRTRRAGTLVWPEAFDRRWEARWHGHALPHDRAFGWANAFRVPGPGRVQVVHHGLPLRAAGLVVETGLWVAAVWWWRRRRSSAPQPGAVVHDPAPVDPAGPPESPPPSSPLDLPVAP